MRGSSVDATNVLMSRLDTASAPGAHGMIESKPVRIPLTREGTNSKLLCKSLSLLSFVKILLFWKDRVVMRAYDDSRESASKMQMKIRQKVTLSSFMLVYELYTFNKKKGYELIGVLPERRKNRTRITKESVIRWGRMLLGDDDNSKDIFFKPIAIENAADGILWRDLSDPSTRNIS